MIKKTILFSLISASINLEAMEVKILSEQVKIAKLFRVQAEKERIRLATLKADVETLYDPTPHSAPSARPAVTSATSTTTRSSIAASTSSSTSLSSTRANIRESMVALAFTPTDPSALTPALERHAPKTGHTYNVIRPLPLETESSRPSIIKPLDRTAVDSTSPITLELVDSSVLPNFIPGDDTKPTHELKHAHERKQDFEIKPVPEIKHTAERIKIQHKTALSKTNWPPKNWATATAHEISMVPGFKKIEKLFPKDVADMISAYLPIQTMAPQLCTAPAPIVSRYQGDHSNVYDATFTPDGTKFIATEYSGKFATNLYYVAIYDFNGKYLNDFELPAYSRGAIFFTCSPDKQLIAASFFGTHVVCIWTIHGKLVCQIDCPNDVNKSKFNHGSTQIITAHRDGRARLWNIADKKLIRTFENGHAFEITDVCFNHDDSLIATSGRDRIICIWHADTGTLMHSITSERGTIYSVSFNHDGSFLLLGGNQNQVELWDVTTGKHKKSFLSYNFLVPSLNTIHTAKACFNHDYSRIAACATNGKIYVWDAATSELEYKFQAHPEGFISVQWSPDGRFIISCGRDSKVKIWHILPRDHRLTAAQINLLASAHSFAKLKKYKKCSLEKLAQHPLFAQDLKELIKTFSELNPNMQKLIQKSYKIKLPTNSCCTIM